jgi:hypothetical protein
MPARTRQTPAVFAAVTDTSYQDFADSPEPRDGS